MYGCCAPEGMRAIYTTWTNTIDRYGDSPLGPAGVYVNMSFQRESPWGRVVSFMPDEGRISVISSVSDRFFIRPPHWIDSDEIVAFKNSQSIPLAYKNGYVAFDAKSGDELTICYPLYTFKHHVEGLWKNAAPELGLSFTWLGNMVTEAKPPAEETELYLGRPRCLPLAPGL